MKREQAKELLPMIRAMIEQLEEMERILKAIVAAGEQPNEEA